MDGNEWMKQSRRFRFVLGLVSVSTCSFVIFWEVDSDDESIVQWTVFFSSLATHETLPGRDKNNSIELERSAKKKLLLIRGVDLSTTGTGHIDIRMM